MTKITIYEEKQLKEIEIWKNKQPGVVSKTMGTVLKPLEIVTEKLVPRKAIEAVLSGIDFVAKALTDSGDILRNAKVDSIDTLRSHDLELSDKLADEIHNWAVGLASAEGLATGTTGIFGMALDVPASITLCLRTIHKIGICYGFECDNENGRNVVLSIFCAACSNTMKEKQSALLTLQKIGTMVAKKTWKEIAKDTGIIALIITTIRQLAKQIGINITKRKAAQLIPLAGGAVGAAVNAALLNDVAWASRRMFQELWLRENRKISD